MTNVKSILLSSLWVLLSCGQTTGGSTLTTGESNTPSYSKSSFPEYIIFGVYCGECVGHCATMYKLYTLGNVNTLWVDSTDSYFKNSEEIKFEKSVTDTRRFNLAQGIVQQIPAELLTTTKVSESFGCPDCADGCGIYFQFKTSTGVKKFYIDYQTSVLKGEIKKFAEYLKTTIEELNAKQ